MEDYVKRSKCLQYYFVEKQNLKMCIFYALAIFRGVDKNKHGVLRYFGKKFLDMYMKKTDQDEKVFNGVDICDITRFEIIFNVPIMIYELLNGTKKCIFKTSNRFENPKLYLLKVDRYKYAYITDINAFWDNCMCEKCRKIFLTRNNLAKHNKTCLEKIENINKIPKLFYPKNHIIKIINLNITKQILK